MTARTLLCIYCLHDSKLTEEHNYRNDFSTQLCARKAAGGWGNPVAANDFFLVAGVF
jgi:hypothetical protein